MVGLSTPGSLSRDGFFCIWQQCRQQSANFASKERWCYPVSVTTGLGENLLSLLVALETFT
jgi:hypothetical protein